MTIRCGSVCYASSQGLGQLAKSFFDAGIIAEAVIYEHPNGRETHRDWYPAGTPVVAGRDFATRHRATIDRLLDRIDVLLCFETPFDWNLLPAAKAAGVRTVLVPMYEWSLLDPPHAFDKFVCPSKLDQHYFPGAPFVPVPVDGSRWAPRTRARRFLHNAGGIGSREHKGTRQLIEAVPFIRSPVELTIRAQSKALARIVADNPGVRDDPRVTVEIGERDYGTLWDGFDVLVAPEKFNGLSLPLQEAFAAGMMVMTTDRFPMNDWLPRGPLIPVADVQTVQVMGGHNRIEESAVEPVAIARCIDDWYDADIAAFSEAGRRYADANSWDALKPKWMEALETP